LFSDAACPAKHAKYPAPAPWLLGILRIRIHVAAVHWSEVGPSETCGSDRMSGLRKNRPRTSLRTSRHRRDEPHTTARPMWPGSGKIGPMLWQGSRKPREAQQWRRLIGSVVNGNGALDTIRTCDLCLRREVLLRLHPKLSVFANASGAKEICSWRKVEEAKTMCRRICLKSLILLALPRGIEPLFQP
jgi:hypothetical protein